MEKANSRLTVYFEDPFWVGIFEREANGQYQACKVTFGAEPRDCEVYAFILSRRYEQLSFSPSTAAETAAEKRLSPKRAQKAAARQLEERGAGTRPSRLCSSSGSRANRPERPALGRTGRQNRPAASLCAGKSAKKSTEDIKSSVLQAVKKVLLGFFDSLKQCRYFCPTSGQKSSLCSPHALLCKALRSIRSHSRRACAPSSSPPSSYTAFSTTDRFFDRLKAQRILSPLCFFAFLNIR